MAKGHQNQGKKQHPAALIFDRKQRRRFGLAVLGVSLIVVITFMVSRPRESNSTSEQEQDGQTKAQLNISPPGNIEFDKDGELVFLTAGGIEISKIDIEIAESSLETIQGMMYRSELADGQGMLFIFPFEGPRSFWMKNTQIPLDIIFVNSNLTIVTIQKDAIPFDESSYPSIQPAKFVIEVNAGYADDYGIEIGDKIKWTETL